MTPHDTKTNGITTETRRTRRAAEEARKDGLTRDILSAAIEVHRLLGPGLLECAYEEALARELTLRSIPFERQKFVPITYKGTLLESRLCIDLVVAKRVVVELKSVETLLPVHDAQLITYLRLTGCPVGLLVNFNVKVLRDGVRRKVNSLRPSASSAPLR